MRSGCDIIITQSISQSFWLKGFFFLWKFGVASSVVTTGSGKLDETFAD